MRHFLLGRGLAMLALALVFSGGAFALTASNTVPTSRAGDGAETITGYTASSVAYTLNSTSPDSIDQVAFNLDATSGTYSPPSTVEIKLVASGSDWYSCTVDGTDNTLWTCATTSPQAAVETSDELQIVAAE